MRAWSLLLVLLLAGCVSPPSIPSPTDPLGDLLPVLKAPVAVSLDAPSSEPVIAVASDGTIYLEGVGSAGGPVRNTVNKVWRSRDDGATWTDITPPAIGEKASFDGYLAVGNRDTLYAMNVFGLTFEMYRSEDRGDTWLLLQPPRLPLFMHRNWIVPVGDATIHVVQEALPPSFIPALVGGPQVPVSTFNEGLWYMRSEDRGTTWTTPVQIDPIVNFAGQGNLAIDATGQNLYVVRYEDALAPPQYERGAWYLLVSEDAGRTWERREMFPLTSELASAVMPITVDPAGTLFFAWSQLDEGSSRLFLRHSMDGGLTWSEPWAVTGRSGAESMVWIEARGVGEVAAVWYATHVAGSATKVDADWFVDFAWIMDASGAEPTTYLERLTLDPVHRGNICAKGPACVAGKEDRRLLDYPWIDLGPDGRAHMAYASTKWDKPSAFAGYGGEAISFRPIA